MFELRAISVWFDTHFPHESSARKVASIVSLALVIEGLFVVFLFSYVGLVLGLLSIVLGSFLYVFVREELDSTSKEPNTPGIRLVDFMFTRVGGEYPVIFMGAAVIVAVLVYNRMSSSNPEIGDLDTLSIAFAVSVMTYPIARYRFRIEATFALIFIGLVMILLVIPQFIVSIVGGDGTSGAGNWYVHYMLAAPFAAILDFIGIPASSLADMVTITFQDGSTHTLRISAYCAGLYSFSIFLSAFISFVLVFERLQKQLLAFIVVLGVIVAYLGNLLRMVVIGLVGYYRGIDALHWAHENAGWMVFLAWSSLFWWIILNYASKHAVIRALTSPK